LQRNTEEEEEGRRARGEWRKRIKRATRN